MTGVELTHFIEFFLEFGEVIAMESVDVTVQFSLQDSDPYMTYVLLPS
jgi:hypothetical protein